MASLPLFTSYLDHLEPTDVSRLPKDLRTLSTLPETLQEAMVDLVAYYTVPTSRVKGDTTGLETAGAYAVVCIRGFAANVDDADAGTVEAVKRELVRLVRWKHAQGEMSLVAKSRSTGKDGASTTWRDDAAGTYPPGFGQALEPFDAREAILSGVVNVDSEPLYTI